MKIENILKSVVIAGLLSGVTDAQAAKVGGREGCHLLIVENNSHLNSKNTPKTDYWVEANFVSCNVESKTHSKAIVLPGKPRTFCVEPDTDVWMEQRKYQDKSRKETWHIKHTKTGIDVGWHYICSGDVDSVACRRDPATEDENKANAKCTGPSPSNPPVPALPITPKK